MLWLRLDGSSNTVTLCGISVTQMSLILGGGWDYLALVEVCALLSASLVISRYPVLMKDLSPFHCYFSAESVYPDIAPARLTEWCGVCLRNI